VSGRDRPGITTALVAILGRYRVNVLDIDQAVIHNNLAWGMLVDVEPADANAADQPTENTDALFRELLFKAHELDLDIRFTPVSDTEYQAWCDAGGQSRHIITLLGTRMAAEQVSDVSSIISERGWNIASIQRISPRLPLSQPSSHKLAALELRIRGEQQSISDLRAACLSLSSKIDADIAIQEDNIWRRNRRLICFDMDSTLIQDEAIDLMAAAAGTGDQVAAITARAMNGEIDFRESFTQRLALLKGLPEQALATIDNEIQTTSGAEKLIRNLKRLGYKTAILSGGFTWFAERLQQRLGIDHVHANQLEIVDGVLTGKVIGDIVDEARKASLLQQIAEAEGVRLEQTIAVGDGANDIPMLSIAGLGIAFHAKPAVRAQAKNAFGTVGLDAILYLIGMREDELL
jgi:phosphoserine phosphatase